nr:immunoglobulin heavy chain junction region [Mus musculus]MBK4195231.1 immunoglobulin heavy chain junction region [Mus musculus]
CARGRLYYGSSYDAMDYW